MGDVNNRNYQLKLAFQDDDLRKPKHDEMMHWLDRWLRNIENVRPFLSPRPRRYVETTTVLDRESLSLVNSSKDRDSIISQLKRDSQAERQWVSQPWDDEPPMAISYKGRSWEPMLNAEAGSYNRLLGFCDLMVRYEVSAELARKVCLTKKILSVHPDKNLSKPYFPKWVFEDVGSQCSYEDGTGARDLYFEVKTEIKSIGELMRQVQLYRSSVELKRARDYNGIALIVVAPPHDEAAKVLRSHSVGFIEYRPLDGAGLVSI